MDHRHVLLHPQETRYGREPAQGGRMCRKGREPQKIHVLFRSQGLQQGRMEARLPAACPIYEGPKQNALREGLGGS